MATLKQRLETLEHTTRPGVGLGCAVVEYESADHLERIICTAQNSGSPRCVIALPSNGRSGSGS